MTEKDQAENQMEESKPAKTGLRDLPDEMLLNVLRQIRTSDSGNVRLASKRLEHVVNTVILDKSRQAAEAIYDHLLPEGTNFEERSGLNRQPYEGPQTDQTVLALALLMNVIPKRQPHLVGKILKIKDDYVRAQAIDTTSFLYDHFEKPNLAPLIDESIRLVEIRNDDLSKSPAIRATKALSRSKGYCTKKQASCLSTLVRENPDFRRSMFPRGEESIDDLFNPRAKSSLQLEDINALSISYIHQNATRSRHPRLAALTSMARDLSDRASIIKTPYDEIKAVAIDKPDRFGLKRYPRFDPDAIDWMGTSSEAARLPVTEQNSADGRQAKPQGPLQVTSSGQSNPRAFPDRSSDRGGGRAD